MAMPAMWRPDDHNRTAESDSDPAPLPSCTASPTSMTGTLSSQTIDDGLAALLRALAFRTLRNRTLDPLALSPDHGGVRSPGAMSPTESSECSLLTPTAPPCAREFGRLRLTL